ncbi:MAG: glucosyl-3-phosphoglycerate synthase [Desulfobacterales bacterium]|uniref:Glucosyl-3-phosphoglycerate synthase n=1 Tax=Candidatus Desulfaltia bathyphila TaxID=2841697 RepID=A0A8J6N704_9BACT|nr:glucosyl-3-phosphoglycerate synthase [Candidatus Desulfaltia bathyphila]MBL7194733.1 glucosyl-3-phosphoglycerate synthase [Desulfobacterales bacterium]MBL7206950.1 glucosyl-3-phosphoglycerate synthase [Desulfobacterales bacterium]
MNNNWLKKNTFHHSEFKDINHLVEEKTRKNLTIALCLPTLNEEKTIAKEIIIIKSELMTHYPLIDEIVVIDSGSTDNTRKIAREYGAEVYKATDILPDIEAFKGKGENLWKALYITNSDIIVYLDADIKNIHHRFVYALVGPLILFDNIKFSKAFYDRPIATGKSKIRPTGGGRVTELVIRPLLSLFFPELTQIMQPLSGEYAGYRELFEKIPFPIGYGVETSMLLDIYEKWGLDVIAQVDLDKRVHRNQDTKALGRMAFVILKTFCNRIEKLGIVNLNKEIFDEMIQYNLIRNEYKPTIFKIKGVERPPIIEINEYRKKFNIM